MNRREWCKRACVSAAVLAVNPVQHVSSSPMPTIKELSSVRRRIEGNYEMTAEIIGSNAAVSFSGREDWQIKAAIELSENSIALVRYENGSRLILKQHGSGTRSPWRVRLLKKGNFFRYWVNDISGWIREPLGVWESDHPTRHCEPANGFLGVEAREGRISSCNLTSLPWLESLTSPLIKAGPDGTFKEAHVLVGGLIERGGVYYQYFSGSRFGCQEGGGAREIGVAHSRDLNQWVVEPEPILKIGSKGSWEPTGIYCSGAVVTPDGKIAVLWAAQNFPYWGGFGVAFADHPLGPFQKFPGNPVYKFVSHAHEFDVVRTDEPGRRYLMFFSGFTEKPSRGPAGDRGYILYSDDLIHWENHESNPVFGPETLDNWDAVHVRPRSLNRIDDTWYLWYEGANHWDPPTLVGDGTRVAGWWDTVGLARSKDLVNWEYYPRNPALPAMGVSKEQFDTSWVGWPRMFIKNEVGYVYYTGGRHIGVRTIPIDRLTNWYSEGGSTIDMLKGEL